MSEQIGEARIPYEYKNTGPVDCSKKFDSSAVKGKTAIVTGAYVVIADLNEDAAKKIQQEFPDTTAAIKCDVLAWKDQLATFKKAIELFPQ
ncbi:hypothetical protein LTR09_003598 [Extremus antarcticus]|uniref:YCII-related domain-containing protein n=1 Tax=Extremus antarcticus TaxID=702011 RepID=A0AAJ0DRR2_9PEZI|nr:hypothetical protein LTR09_003598 [Extremus antarcticus]